MSAMQDVLIKTLTTERNLAVAEAITLRADQYRLSLTIQTFFVPGPLPGANDIIRKHHMVYAKLKNEWGVTCARCILVAKLKRVQYCRISFLWQEKHGRRDDDNVIFGQKFILDALRDTKIIPDDRRQFIHSLTHRVIVVPTNPGVLVTVEAL